MTETRDAEPMLIDGMLERGRPAHEGLLTAPLRELPVTW